MSKPIEPGVRVYIGWTSAPPHMQRAVCNYGWVIEGPFPPGRYGSPDGVVTLHDWSWNCELDDGFGFCAAEAIIFPVDDDGDCDMTQEDHRDHALQHQA